MTSTIFLNQKIKIMIFVMLLFSFSAFAAEPGKVEIKLLYEFLALGTGSTTGTYFPLGSAFANVWSTRLERISVMAHSTRGSVDNIRLLRRHELNIAIAQSDIVLSARKGTGSFLGEPYLNLRVLTALFPEVVQIVVPADSDIQNIGQLGGHRVAVGSRGSGNALTSLELMAAIGIGESQFEPVYLSYDESIQAMEKGEYAAAIIIAGVPTRAIIELDQRIGIRILGFTSAEISHLKNELPYLSPIAIEANAYSGQSKKIETLALMALLITNERLADNLAHRLLQIIFANLDYLKGIHERAADILPQNYLKGVPDGCLHPGAARFFNELDPSK